LQRARRLDEVPPYPFAELQRKLREARAQGIDVIDLGVGDPDRPTPPAIVERLCREAANPEHHRYPDYAGSPAFRRAVAAWYRRRYGVELDPDREVLALIGSKEGLAHLPWAVLNPGDVALVPDPAYPVYRVQSLLAGGVPYPLPLREERGFLPDVAGVPEEVAGRARLMFLNYPNNPTGAVADLEAFEGVVDFCRRHRVLLCHDAAYADLVLDGPPAPSPLQVAGAREVVVEVGSLSKPFNMTGWRIAYAVGNADALGALGVIKTNTDSGQFTAIQHAAIHALESEAGGAIRAMTGLYRQRRDRTVEVLARLGFRVRPPSATFYLWVPIPEGWTSAGFAEHVLSAAGVLVTPGSAYGDHGEGYVRLSLTVPDDRLDEALRRLGSRPDLARPRG